MVRLVGEYVASRKKEVCDFVRMMSEATQIPFEKTSAELVTKPYQWKELQDARYGWKGDVVMKVEKKEEVVRLFSKLEGKSIDVAGGGKIVIEVLPHISLIEEIRNGGGL